MVVFSESNFFRMMLLRKMMGNIYALLGDTSRWRFCNRSKDVVEASFTSHGIIDQGEDAVMIKQEGEL